MDGDAAYWDKDPCGILGGGGWGAEEGKSGHSQFSLAHFEYEMPLPRSEVE